MRAPSALLLIPLCLAAGPLAAQEAPARPRHATELRPVAKVVLGTFMGAVGQDASGVLSGSWGLNQTAVLVSTRGGAGARTRSERMWTFTWDAPHKRLRCRVTGEGLVVTYDVAASEAEQRAGLTLTEAAREGPPGPKRTLVLTRTPQGLTLERMAGEAREVWKLEPLLRTPARRGPLQPGALRVKIPRAAGRELMPAQVYYPKQGKRPLPVMVFSPGGKALRPRGYELFGQWWASWGWVVVVVGFGDTPAADRAKRFGAVADWLKVTNAQPGSVLSSALELKTLVAGGHSRGAHAALLAAQQDARFTACLALAPVGIETLGAGLKKPVALLSGVREAARCHQLYASTQAPKLQVAIAGMDHMFQPPSRARQMLAHATAFLEGVVRGREIYAHWLELARQRGIGVAIERR